MIQWRGSGSTRAKRALALECHNLLRCDSHRGDAVQLRIVPLYQHMGTKTAVGASISQEVAHRTMCLRTGFQRLRNRIFKNPRLDQKRKLTVAECYVFSKGFFQSSTWPELLGGDFRKMHHAVMVVYREVLGHGAEAKTGGKSDDEVIAELQTIAPAVMLKMSRLLLLIRFVQRAPVQLIALTLVAKKSPTSWMAYVEKDLRWLTIGNIFGECKLWTLQDWCHAIASDPCSYRKSIIKYCRSGFASLVTTWAVTKSQRDAQHAWKCEACQANFKSKQGLASHNFQSHGLRRVERCYVDTTHCPICLLEFWTRERLIVHVSEKSTLCKHNLMLRGPVLTESEAMELDRAELGRIRENCKQGLRRTHARKPCVRIEGPLPHVLTFDDETACSRHPLGHGHRWFN